MTGLWNWDADSDVQYQAYSDINSYYDSQNNTKVAKYHLKQQHYSRRWVCVYLNFW